MKIVREKAEQWEMLRYKLNDANNNKLIGAWRETFLGFSHVFIFQRGDKFYLESVDPNGGIGMIDELIEKPDVRGKKFDHKYEDSKAKEHARKVDEHYLIDSSGDLHLWRRTNSGRDELLTKISGEEFRRVIGGECSCFWF